MSRTHLCLNSGIPELQELPVFVTRWLYVYRLHFGLEFQQGTARFDAWGLKVGCRGLELLTRWLRVAAPFTDAEINLPLQACAIVKSYKCYVLNWILILLMNVLM